MKTFATHTITENHLIAMLRTATIAMNINLHWFTYTWCSLFPGDRQGVCFISTWLQLAWLATYVATAVASCVFVCSRLRQEINSWPQKYYHSQLVAFRLPGWTAKWGKSCVIPHLPRARAKKMDWACADLNQRVQRLRFQIPGFQDSKIPVKISRFQVRFQPWCTRFQWVAGPSMWYVMVRCGLLLRSLEILQNCWVGIFEHAQLKAVKSPWKQHLRSWKERGGERQCQAVGS